MKRIIAILACLTFLVASMPGISVQQMTVSGTFEESGSQNEQKSSCEEKQEEHLVHFRARLHTAQQPAHFYHETISSKKAYSIPENLPLSGVPSKFEWQLTPLYVQHASFLI